jgi:hypothetical protein
MKAAVFVAAWILSASNVKRVARPSNAFIVRRLKTVKGDNRPHAGTEDKD